MSSPLIAAPNLRWRWRSRHASHAGKRLLREFNHVLELLREAGATTNTGAISPPCWYLLVGAHDPTRSELLRDCGFDHVLPATLGRRHTPIDRDSGCTHDWYLSADTVLLSLADGCDEPQAAQQRLHVLQALPVMQRKATLGGLIVTLTADAVRDATPGNLQQLRSAMQQVQRDFAALCSPALAVHVLVTHCDQIDGFGAFFRTDAQRSEDRLFGVAADRARSPGDLREQLQQLCRQLHQQTPQRMQAEPDLDARRHVAGFACQFERMQPALASLCTEFAIQRHVDAGMTLGGIYFCGATPTQCLFAKSFFNTLPTAGRSSLRTPHRRGLRGLWQRHARALIALPLLFATATWVYASYSLHEQVHAVRQLLAAEDPHRPPDTLAATVAHLARVQQARAQFSAGAWPWLVRVGMYDATPQQTLAATCAHLLQQAWLPALIDHLMAWADNDARSYAERFDAVKISLMLLQPSRRDAEFMQQWLATSTTFDHLAGLDRQQLLRQLDAFLALPAAPTPPPQHVAAIDVQQRKLSALSPAERIYGTWLEANHTRAVDLDPQLGDAASEIFTRAADDGLRMPVMFTAGFSGALDLPALTTAFLGAQRDLWVLGDHAAVDGDTVTAVVDELRQRYLRDYARAWSDLYASLSLRRPASSNELRRMLQVLSSEQTSPLNRLFTVTRANAPTATEFSRYFQVVPLSVQRRLTAALIALHDASAGDVTATGGQGSMAAQAALREFDRVANDLPAPVSGWLRQLKASYLQLHGTDQARGVRALWRTQVYEPCTTMLGGRYPFSASATTEVAYDDFVEYFRPGGIEDRFVKRHLRHDDAVASAEAGTPASLRLSRNAIVTLQQGQRIRDTFFQDRNPRATFKVRVTPRAMHAQLASYTLQGATFALTYSHGPHLDTQISWPDKGDRLHSRLSTLDGKTLQRDFSGDWALFHWFDHARLRPSGDSKGIDALVREGPYDVTLRLQTSQRRSPPDSPFDRRLFANYRCIAEL